MSLTLVKPSSTAIEIFTDGACSGNPGPGGWGAIVRMPGQKDQELCGGEALTTNNRMELMAAIKALESLNTSSEVAIYTDSMYVRDGMMKWLQNWKKNGWRNSTNKDVKNIDLWQRLDVLCQKFNVDWHWVRGHNGHVENERADLLARNAILQLMMQETMDEAIL